MKAMLNPDQNHRATAKSPAVQQMGLGKMFLAKTVGATTTVTTYPLTVLHPIALAPKAMLNPDQNRSVQNPRSTSTSVSTPMTNNKITQDASFKGTKVKT